MRVYIDNFETDRMWSIDSGPGTPESHWRKVIFLSPGETKEDMSKRGSKTEPCCWIEVDGKLLHGPWELHGLAVIQ